MNFQIATTTEIGRVIVIRTRSTLIAIFHRPDTAQCDWNGKPKEKLLHFPGCTTAKKMLIQLELVQRPCRAMLCYHYLAASLTARHPRPTSASPLLFRLCAPTGLLSPFIMLDIRNACPVKAFVFHLSHTCSHGGLVRDELKPMTEYRRYPISFSVFLRRLHDLAKPQNQSNRMLRQWMLVVLRKIFRAIILHYNHFYSGVAVSSIERRRKRPSIGIRNFDFVGNGTCQYIGSNIRCSSSTVATTLPLPSMPLTSMYRPDRIWLAVGW